MPDKKTYPYIRAWGENIGSMRYYIDMQIEYATRDNAPHNAIYQDLENKKWYTWDEIQSKETKSRIKEMVDSY